MPVRNLRLVVVPDARRDIQAVLMYTEQQWGVSQRRAYRQFIDQAFDELARFPELGRARPKYGTDVRGYRIEQHVASIALSLAN